jgi:hypothetical protein
VSDRPLRVHALYVALNEHEFFEASVRSIYDHVDRITVITTYDRDWHGRSRQPDQLVPSILARTDDPDRKIDLIVSSETSEARSRNRAMDYANPSRASRKVKRQHLLDADSPAVDYFLIVDADEIYEGAALERLYAHVAQHRLPLYKVGLVRYFKRWTHRIDGYEWSTAMIRSDLRFDKLRNRTPNLAQRAFGKAPKVSDDLKSRVRRYEEVDPKVAVFHHGSYVGPRSRIVDKLAAFGHAHELQPNWLENVYDRWTPASRNFHPVVPEWFPSAQEIAVADLPPEIAKHPWPPGYLTD